LYVSFAVSVTTKSQSLGLVGALPIFLTNSDFTNDVGGIVQISLSSQVIVASSQLVVTVRFRGSHILPHHPSVYSVPSYINLLNTGIVSKKNLKV
jgi:hypothetical protein